MKFIKRALVPLVVLVLALGCLVGLTLTAGADDVTTYDLWVGTTQVTSDNQADVLRDGGTVSYDPDTNTLTLNNASITAQRKYIQNYSGTETNLYYGGSGALTIELIGENTIGSTLDQAFYGVYSEQNVTFLGSGTVTFAGNPSVAIGANYSATVTFGDADNSPTVSIPNCTRYGVYTRNISFIRGTFDILCDGSNKAAYGNSNYCTAAAVYATKTLQIGPGSGATVEHDVTLHAKCTSNAWYTHAIYVGSDNGYTLDLSGQTNAIQTPVYGQIKRDNQYSTYYYVIADREGNESMDVTIHVAPLPEGYEAYPLWVSAVQVDSVNCANVLGDGTVSYNATTRTLTLKNATVDYAYKQANSSGTAGIYYTGSDLLTIVAQGSSNIQGANQTYGICAVDAALSFRGNGTINIPNADTCGVFTNWDVLFDEPNSTDDTYHPTLNINAYKGIFADSITLYRAVLQITCSSNEGKGLDVRENITIGQGSKELETNDVLLEVECPNGGTAISTSSGTISISTPNAIELPQNGSISSDGKTIVDSGGATANAVLIHVQPYTVTYDLWVDGEQVTEDTANSLPGGGSFNPETNTLTFTDSPWFRAGHTVGDKTAAIYTTLSELHIVVQSGKEMKVGWPGSALNTGILVPENTVLTVNGDISLMNFVANGIVAGAGSTINLNSGTWDLRGSGISIDAADATVCLNGGTLQLSGETYGMQAGTFTMSGGTLSADITKDTVVSAIQADSFEMSDGTLSADITKDTVVSAIQASSFTMSGGTLTASVSGNAAKAAVKADSFEITGGTLTASVSGNSAEAAVKTDSFEMTGDTLDASVSGDNALGAIYAENGLQISGALQITLPEHCLPWGGSETKFLRDTTGNAATTVEIAPASGEATAYQVWAGSTQITNKNRNNPLGDGTATYDETTHTLYLDGAAISGIYQSNLYGKSSILSLEDKALTISLTGENSLPASGVDYGIRAFKADLHIVGDGSLSVYGYFAGLECGGGYDYTVYFDDPVNRPTVTISAAEFGIHAAYVNIDRADLDINCSGSFPRPNSSYCETAAICAEGSGWYGNIRIGSEEGDGDVILHATVERQKDKCFAIYAKYALNIMDNEGIVTPNGGGVSDNTGVHTVVEGQKNQAAYEVLIQPQEPPAQVVDGYDLWLNGAQICPANKDALPGLPEGCSFNPITSTLHLTGEAVFDRPMLVDSKGCAIYSKLPDLIIELADDAKVDLSGHSYGVFAGRGCNVHIRGSGILDIHDTAYGIVCNDHGGKLYFDDPDTENNRPVLRIEATNNALLSNFIYFWNCNVTASAPTAILATTYYTIPYNQAVYDGGVIEIGTASTDSADAWKNNAAVYATGSSYPMFAQTVLYGDRIVAGSLTLGSGEKILLPNNAEITSYNKNISGFRIRDSISHDDSKTVYIIPLTEEPEHDTPYELWVNGLQVYAANAYDLPGLPGSWFDGDTRTLYLSGYVTLDGVSDGRDAPIYTTLADLNVVLDYGRATLCSEQHSFGIYAAHDLHIRGGAELVVGNATKEAIHAGGTLYFDDVDFAPLVSAYSYQYGIRAGNIVLKQANLNAIVFNTDRTQGSLAVPNAAILADNNLIIGTSSNEVYENNVTLYASCDDTEGYQGYAIYAGSLQHPSKFIEILEPTPGAEWTAHTITHGGSKAGTVRLGMNRTAYYIGGTRDDDEGTVQLSGHADFRAFAGETVSFTVTAKTNYNFVAGSVQVSYYDEATDTDVQVAFTQSGNTYTFTMPAADVYIDTNFENRPYEVILTDPEGGRLEASCEYANAGDRVDVFLYENAGYNYQRLSVTRPDGTEVYYVIDGGTLSSGMGTGHIHFSMPESDVTVTVEFAKAWYYITCGNSEYGNVTSTPTYAEFESTVTLTVTPEDGYELDTITAVDKAGANVPLTLQADGTYTFTMPASDVTVTATYKAEPVPRIVGHSISLKDEIAINYYLWLPASYTAENTGISFTWGKGDYAKTVEGTLYAATGNAAATGANWRVSCYVAA